MFSPCSQAPSLGGIAFNGLVNFLPGALSSSSPSKGVNFSFLLSCGGGNAGRTRLAFIFVDCALSQTCRSHAPPPPPQLCCYLPNLFFYVCTLLRAYMDLKKETLNRYHNWETSTLCHMQKAVVKVRGAEVVKLQFDVVAAYCLY